MLKFQRIITKIGKIEYFRQRINSTQKRKRKAQTDLGGVYKGCEGERCKERDNSTFTASLALKAI